MKRWTPCRRAQQLLAWQIFRDVVSPGTVGAFIICGLLLATLPGAKLGDRGTTIWGLGLVLAAAALLTGLGGAFAPDGIFRSPWLHTMPPGRHARALATAAGIWLATGALLVPAIFFTLPAWQQHAGEIRQHIPIHHISYRPAQGEALFATGSTVNITSTSPRVAHRLAISIIPLYSTTKYNIVTLEAAVNQGAWQLLGTAGVDPEQMVFALSPPQPIKEIRIRRQGEAGQGILIPEDSIKAYGANQSTTLTWLWTGVAAWNLATAAALALGLLGSLLSRPVAILVGSGWAALALADPSFKPGFPALEVTAGFSCGADLWGGRGWLPLLFALACTLTLALRPGVARLEER